VRWSVSQCGDAEREGWIGVIVAGDESAAVLEALGDSRFTLSVPGTNSRMRDEVSGKRVIWWQIEWANIGSTGAAVQVKYFCGMRCGWGHVVRLENDGGTWHAVSADSYYVV